MFQNSGLSLDQAPPINVVLRFFLTGAIFGIIGSIMLFFWSDSIKEISNPKTLAIVHTFTLGVMASFMLGALFQMMPVLCGVAIKAPNELSLRVNYALLFGTLFLIISFIKTSTALYVLAFIFLSYAIFMAALTMIYKLNKIEHSSSSRGMLIALISLIITALMGLTLLSIRIGAPLNIDYTKLKYIHFSFGLFGWIALLIISVSFQVIEMFYVTPPYNKRYTKVIPTIIFTTLIIYAFSLFITDILLFLPYIVTFLIALHAIFTLYNLKRKKRPINDATVWFWTLGMVALILFFIVSVLKINTILSATLFSIFALSIMFAMSYKIVPFLVWFHLNAKGYFDAPMMHEVVSPKYARVNLYLFLVASILSICSIFYTKIYYISSAILLLSFLMLAIAIYQALNKYYYTLKHGKRLEFSF